MGTRALGRHQEPVVSAGISVAATHVSECERLCGPPPFVPHFSDSVRGVFRSAARREDRVRDFWWTGSAVVLLAVIEVSDSLPAGMVDRVAGVRAAVSVSNEHGESATFRDHLPDPRDSPVFQTQILAALSARSRFYLDVRPVRFARAGYGFLGRGCFRNRAQVRMAAAGLCAGGLCRGSHHQSIFPTQPATTLGALANQAHCK